MANELYVNKMNYDDLNYDIYDKRIPVNGGTGEVIVYNEDFDEFIFTDINVGVVQQDGDIRSSASEIINDELYVKITPQGDSLDYTYEMVGADKLGAAQEVKNYVDENYQKYITHAGILFGTSPEEKPLDDSNIRTAIPDEDYIPAPNKSLITEDGTFDEPNYFSVVRSNDGEYFLKNCNIPNTAAAHNSYYRGYDLTGKEEEISQKIANNDWSDLYIGDYITKEITSDAGTETVTFVIAGFNYFLNHGDDDLGGLQDNHIVFVMKDCFKDAYNMIEDINYPTAYATENNLIYTDVLPMYSNSIVEAFGEDHVIEHSRRLGTNCSISGISCCGAGGSGYTNAADFKRTKFELLTEGMLYGYHKCASSFWDNADAMIQLPLFRLSPEHIIAGDGYLGARTSYWLSDLADAQSYCCTWANGFSFRALGDSNLSVRGYFLFK